MFLEWLNFILSKITFFAGSILPNNCFPKPLEKEEEQELLKKVRLGDKQAKDKLITHNMRLVAHMVKKYSGACEQDDLISVGSICLIKAISSYKEEKGTSLATYTARCIENEILMLLRSNKKRKVEVSLSDAIGHDKDGNELTLIDLLTDENDGVLERVHKEIEKEKLLKFLKASLTDREYKVIVLRFGLKGIKAYTQREVASFLKISRSYISRIETKAIEKLKVAVKKYQIYC